MSSVFAHFLEGTPRTTIHIACVCLPLQEVCKNGRHLFSESVRKQVVAKRSSVLTNNKISPDILHFHSTFYCRVDISRATEDQPTQSHHHPVFGKQHLSCHLRDNVRTWVACCLLLLLMQGSPACVKVYSKSILKQLV